MQGEVKKRQRHVETAFQSLAFNRKTINALSAKIKGYWERGKEVLDERKKVYDDPASKKPSRCARSSRNIARALKLSLLCASSMT